MIDDIAFSLILLDEYDTKIWTKIQKLVSFSAHHSHYEEIKYQTEKDFFKK